MQVAVSRHTEAAHVNSILNHPDVYPFVKGAMEGPFDLSAELTSDNIVALYGEHGGQVYQRLLPCLWEAHSAVTPAGRGPWALEATQQSLAWMFTHTDAAEIVTRCPQGNLPAKALARLIGGSLQFTRQDGWVKDGKSISAEVYSLRVEDWMRNASNLVERGRWFHERLEAELERHGAKELAHPDDENHDRYVGAAVEMFFGGQPLKAQVLYNRFAVMAGYHPIQVVSLDPLAVDIGTALLIMREDDFYIPDLKQRAQQG
jgi:hypothetical protein